MMFPHTITIFNTYEYEDEDNYVRSVVHNVLFVQDDSTTRNVSGLANADTVTVYIPNISIEKCNNKYVEPAEFAQLSDTDKNLSFTLRKGDFVSLGDIELGSYSINEYKNLFGNLFEVTGVAYNRFGGLKNLVLSAK